MQSKFKVKNKDTKTVPGRRNCRLGRDELFSFETGTTRSNVRQKFLEELFLWIEEQENFGKKIFADEFVKVSLVKTSSNTVLFYAVLVAVIIVYS